MSESVEHIKLLPCPFCGSEDLRLDNTMFCDDDGEHPGVECLDCDAMNRTEHWNERSHSKYEVRVGPGGEQVWRLL